MPTLATTTIDDGHLTAEFTVTEARNGDVVITRRVIGADVLRPDTFHVPAGLRSWLAEVIPLAVTQMAEVVVPFRLQLVPGRPGNRGEGWP
jgi:hypothetical protein